MFAVMTYVFEVNDPLILSAYWAFKKLDETCGIGSAKGAVIPLPSVEEISPTIIPFMEKAHARLERKIKSEEAVVKEK